MSPLKLDYYTALLSLVDAKGQPIDGYIATHLNALKSNGVTHALVCGTTGEFAHLSLHQRKAYLEAVVKANEGVGLSLMVQIGASNLADTLELQQHAFYHNHVTETLLMPPFYFPQSELNGLADYINTVQSNQPDGKPLYVYHYPQISGIEITPELLKACPGLAGIKDSEGNLARMEQIHTDFPHLRILAGTDYQMIACERVGCAGIISGLANVFPHLVGQAIAQPDKAIENGLQSLRQIIKGYPKPAALKAILNVLGLYNQDTVPVSPINALPVPVIESLATAINTQLEELENNGTIASLSPA